MTFEERLGLTVEFTSSMHAPTSDACVRSRKKKNRPNIRGGHALPGRLSFRYLFPRIEPCDSSTVASPARLLDPVVSGSLLMQVPIIAKTPPPVKSFFEHFETISMPPPLSCRCALTSTSCGAVLQLLRRHNSRRILCERLLIVGQRKRWTRTPRAAHRVSQASLSVAGSP